MIKMRQVYTGIEILEQRTAKDWEGAGDKKRPVL
jgi:hypothetical protein